MPHDSPYEPEDGPNNSCFALCESCWAHLDPPERLPYYHRLVDLWIAQGREAGIAKDYEVLRPLIREAVLAGA